MADGVGQRGSAGTEAVIMPRLDMTTEAMTILRWMKGEGEFVEAGEPLLEVMTEKIAIEIEASASGYVRDLRFGPESVVPVGEIIAYITETATEPLPGNESMASDRGEGVAAGVVAVGNEAARNEAARDGGGDLASVPTTSSGRVESVVRAAPLVRRMAAELGVELEDVSGTGPGGRVLADDVRRVAASQGRDTREAGARGAGVHRTGTEPRLGTEPAMEPPTVVEEPTVTEERLSPMRLAIARRMEASWRDAPHVTLTIDVDMSEAAVFRAGLQQALEAEGGPAGDVGSDVLATDVPSDVSAIDVGSDVIATDAGSDAIKPISMTWNSFIAWVAVQALVRQPGLNATLEGDVLRRYDDVHLGVAVDTDGGLLVPVVRGAQRMGPGRLAAAITKAVNKTHAGRLMPVDVTGGTFTVTNLGGFGITAFTPIINPPQVAILGVGAVRERVIPVDGKPAVRPVATFALSIDHRALDGADGARYLAVLKDLLLHPYRLIV